VCYWDLTFADTDGAEKDTSAAAIAAAGLLELSEQLVQDASRARRLREAALRSLATLAERHASRDALQDGILLHGVYNRPQRLGVNESCLWGDYFYAEALLRLHGRWSSFW
jgi:unsaturated chondroitin disaccharide hydrolase